MLKISKLIASIAIASSAMIGTNANAVLLPNLGCLRLHGDTDNCFISPEESGQFCYLNGPSVNGSCVTKFIRIGAGREFSLHAVSNNWNSNRSFSSEVSIQRDDGVLIHKEPLSCPAGYCTPSFVRKFKNSHKRNKSFQARLKSFNADSSDANVVAVIYNY